jgi:hypothetical protein
MTTTITRTAGGAKNRRMTHHHQLKTTHCHPTATSRATTAGCLNRERKKRYDSAKKINTTATTTAATTATTTTTTATKTKTKQ